MKPLTLYFPILLVLFLMVSCSDTNSMESADIPDSMRPKILAKIVKETGLNLPVESKLIHFLEPDRFIDPIWVAKVQIPVSSYEDFKEVVIKKPTEKMGYKGALADSTSWWKPTNIVLRNQYLADRNTFVVLVLSKEGDDFFVYIECAVF